MTENRLWAFLAYLLSIVGVVLVFFLQKKDKFAVYHAKQSLVLFIAFAIVKAAQWVIFFLGFIWMILYAILFILWVIGMLNALQGKKKPLPLIGQLGERIQL